MTSMLAAATALHNHQPRIIHRDINPNNILRLQDGTWALADFGLAKFIGSAAVATTFATKTQMAWGTAYYAAPEQFRDFKRTDERTDVHALGMLLWDLFSHGWPPPERRDPGLPAPLDEIFLRATEREPRDRYSSVEEMRLLFDKAAEDFHKGSGRTL